MGPTTPGGEPYAGGMESSCGRRTVLGMMQGRAQVKVSQKSILMLLFSRLLRIEKGYKMGFEGRDSLADHVET